MSVIWTRTADGLRLNELHTFEINVIDCDYVVLIASALSVVWHHIFTRAERSSAIKEAKMDSKGLPPKYDMGTLHQLVPFET